MPGGADGMRQLVTLGLQSQADHVQKVNVDYKHAWE